MAKYKKRADGRYCTSIMLNIDGEKKKKYVYGKTIKEVDDKIAELRAASNKGIVVDDREVTAEQWAKLWLETYKRGKVEINTYKGYEYSVNVHIIPAIGTKRLSEIHRNELQSILNKLIDNGHFATAKKVSLTLGQMFRTAAEEQYIFKDVSSGLKLPSAVKQEKRVLSDEEIKNLQSVELEPKQRAFVDILMYTGLRRGEALALLPSDIDFDHKKIHVNKTLIFGSNQSTVKNSTKSAAGMRTLPMPDKLADTLRPIISDDVLFPAAHGGYMSRGAFRRFWDRLHAMAGLADDVTPHIFRHTYATKLFYSGVDVKTAQYLLGHSSVSVTLGIYTHLQNADNNKYIHKLNNLYVIKPAYKLKKGIFKFVGKLSESCQNASG
ncbi:MAG: tyrosine-type recombinase/integrase [Candidatus Ornithomonoglobus sp.]